VVLEPKVIRGTLTGLRHRILPGDVFQLAQSWRILRIGNGVVRVAVRRPAARRWRSGSARRRAADE